MIARSVFLAMALARVDEPQDPDRLPFPSAELKALKDSNLFAPARSKSRPSTAPRTSPRGEPVPEPPARPKPPVVTGIFYDAAAAAWTAVVEDRNDERLRQFREPKFVKEGDTVGTVAVLSVTSDRAAFSLGAEIKEVRVGGNLPETAAAPVSTPSTSPSKDPAPAPGVEAAPVDAGARSEVMEALKKRIKKKNRPSDDE